jgi:hypothetical protein
MTSAFKEGLYLIRTREFENKNENIYKIGRSNNLYNRIISYPNHSVIYLLVECNDSVKHETELIKLFSDKYFLEDEYGKEFFSGELKNMIKDIKKYFTKILPNIQIRYINKPIIINKSHKINKKCKTFIDIENEINKTNNDNDNDNDITSINKINKMKTNSIFNNDNKDDNKDNNNSDDNSIDNNKKCKRCNKEFKFFSHLQRHQNKKYPCKYNNQDNTPNNSIIINYNICQYCNKTLSSKFSKERHLKSCTKKLSEEIKDNGIDVDSKIIDNKKLFEKNRIKSFIEDRIFSNENSEENKDYLLSLIKELLHVNFDKNISNNDISNNKNNENLEINNMFDIKSIGNMQVKDFINLFKIANKN